MASKMGDKRFNIKEAIDLFSSDCNNFHCLVENFILQGAEKDQESLISLKEELLVQFRSLLDTVTKGGKIEFMGIFIDTLATIYLVNFLIGAPRYESVIDDPISYSLNDATKGELAEMIKAFNKKTLESTVSDQIKVIRDIVVRFKSKIVEEVIRNLIDSDTIVVDDEDDDSDSMTDFEI